MDTDPGQAEGVTENPSKTGAPDGSPVELAATVWPAMPARPLVLVPVGSVEQHGPHLPVSTDMVVAAAVVAAAAADLTGIQTGEAVVVAPAVAYGASGEHQAFPGTVSIGTAALRTVLVEMVRSLAVWAGRVVFVNGHGGNLPALTQAVRQMRGEGHDVGWVPCGVPGGDAHAGRTETSLMLHLAPDLVHLDVAVPGVTTPLEEILPRLQREGVRSVSPTGILGDPTGATAADGRRLFQAIVTSIRASLDAADVDRHGRLTGRPDGSSP